MSLISFAWPNGITKNLIINSCLLFTSWVTEVIPLYIRHLTPFITHVLVKGTHILAEVAAGAGAVVFGQVPFFALRLNSHIANRLVGDVECMVAFIERASLGRELWSGKCFVRSGSENSPRHWTGTLLEKNFRISLQGGGGQESMESSFIHRPLIIKCKFRRIVDATRFRVSDFQFSISAKILLIYQTVYLPCFAVFHRI